MDKWNGYIIDPQNTFRNNQSISYNRKKNSEGLFRGAQAFILGAHQKYNAENIDVRPEKKNAASEEKEC